MIRAKLVVPVGADDDGLAFSNAAADETQEVEGCLVRPRETSGTKGLVELLALPEYGSEWEPSVSRAAREVRFSSCTSSRNWGAADWPHRPGQSHLAFRSGRCGESGRAVGRKGGSYLDEIATWTAPSGKLATFVFMRDPEGNLVDLWARAKPGDGVS